MEATMESLKGTLERAMLQGVVAGGRDEGNCTKAYRKGERAARADFSRSGGFCHDFRVTVCARYWEMLHRNRGDLYFQDFNDGYYDQICELWPNFRVALAVGAWVE